MINEKDITIIIPTRANVDYLRTCLESIRVFYQSVSIIVGADNPTPEVVSFLEDNKDNYGISVKFFEAPEGKSRQGIVHVVDALVQEATTPFVYYLHDDMVVGQQTLINLSRYWKEGWVLSSFRVEPPLYPQTPEKLIADLGETPEEFRHNEFLQYEAELCNKHSMTLVEGFFAPHFFAKKDWVGYDELFKPQSREDSDLALRFMEEGFELFTVWDSVVYHFSGKGSRKKDNQNDSMEWKITNYKNTKNYIRKWGTLKHTKYILPKKAPEIPITAYVLVGNEPQETLFKFIDNIEPWFDEIIFMIDSDQKQLTINRNIKTIQDYSNKLFSDDMKPTNFNPDKFRVKTFSLNNDFAAMTNEAISYCRNDWVMKLDVDEVFPENLLSNLRFNIKQELAKNPNVTVIGFGRLNYLDNKLVNDIPREHWFTNAFDYYPDRPEEVKNLDLQFRLHKRSEKWVGKVHEVPLSVARKDFERITVIEDIYIQHPKSREKQLAQQEFYNKIGTRKDKKEINTFVYDSVIYTVEGITKHAREEVLSLNRKDKKVLLLDQNYRDVFGEEFKTFYEPVDFFQDDYVTIVNQPPGRWDRYANLKNRIGYLAFEGLLPDEWVEKINTSNIIELWTPSTYCEEMFIDSGVKKPINVIPHGVDPEVWQPKTVDDQELIDVKGDHFLFLAVGTFHNSRKGFDLLAKAFSEEFSKEEKVKLLFKVNKIYNPHDTFNKYITQYLNKDGNVNVEYYDTDLTEESMVDLFNIADVYVSPHRAEGFGINILNALAVGTPTVVTGATGSMDFCTGDNSLLVDVKEERWAPYIPPYNNARWPEPDVESLKKQLRFAYENYKVLKETSLVESVRIREDYSWDKITERMIARVKEIC